MNLLNIENKSETLKIYDAFFSRIVLAQQE